MLSPESRDSPPRIGLDLLCLLEERTGLATQAWWLAHWMPRLEPNFRFVFFLTPGVAPPAKEANVEVVTVAVGRHRGARIKAEQWDLARLAGRARLDLMHSIAFAPPILYKGLKVLTVHDLGFRVHPDTLPWRYRSYWNWAYGPAARGCRRIIAVSESTRSDVLKFLGRRAAEVTVIHPGVDPLFTPSSGDHDDLSTLARLGVPTQYILNVGTLQPRKDLATLLETFSRIHRLRADLHLVVCGGQGWGYGNPDLLARKYGLQGFVVFMGYTPQEVMPTLYRNAQLLLFTSRYEGFGLPLLEAMASGTPVVATRTSSIPEVTGEAALLAESGDADSLAAHALLVIRAPETRAHLVHLGLERAKRFTWDTAALKTLDVYRELLDLGPRDSGQNRGHELGSIHREDP